MKVSLIPTFGIAVIAASILWAGNARADARNDKRILRKAGGKENGSLTNVVITTYPDGGGAPTTVVSFDRTGSAKIPPKKGAASSPVIHGGPEDGLDSRSTGRVKTAKVKRNGTKIVYKGNGSTTPIFDDESDYVGIAKGTSTIKGSKVKSSGKVNGSRTRLSGDKEFVTANVKGKGKF